MCVHRLELRPDKIPMRLHCNEYFKTFDERYFSECIMFCRPEMRYYTWSPTEILSFN